MEHLIQITADELFQRIEQGHNQPSDFKAISIDSDGIKYALREEIYSNLSPRETKSYQQHPNHKLTGYTRNNELAAPGHKVVTVPKTKATIHTAPSLQALIKSFNPQFVQKINSQFNAKNKHLTSVDKEAKELKESQLITSSKYLTSVDKEAKELTSYK